MTKKCKQCGEEFEGDSKKFCSRECYYRSRRKIPRKKVKELWEEGLNDAQIAYELDVSKGAIYGIRNKELDLPANSPRGAKKDNYYFVVTMDGADGEMVGRPNWRMKARRWIGHSRKLFLYKKKYVEIWKGQVIGVNEGEIWFKVRDEWIRERKGWEDIKGDIFSFFGKRSLMSFQTLVEDIREEFELLEVNKCK